MGQHSFDHLGERRRMMAVAAATIGIILALASCSDSTTSVSTVASVTVSPAADTVEVGNTISLAATAKDAGGIVLSRSFSWTSSDTTVATVSLLGVVTARAVGTANITATSGGVAGTSAVTVTAAAGAARFNHVFVVNMLQKDYSVVFPGTTIPMPYLDSLARFNGSATAYFGNSVPSIGNFYMLAVGDTVTADDNDATVVTRDNIIRRLIAANRTWRSYAESIPSAGYTGPTQGLYVRHHNVVVNLSDVRNDPVQRQNVVPLTALAQDIANGTLPNFGIIVPNECNNSNTCGLDTADAWLRSTLAPLFASPQFQASGMLIILFDRSNKSMTRGGGQVPWVIVSPQARVAYRSNTIYQHQSTLRFVLWGLGITDSLPGLAATAPNMTEFLR